MRIPWCLFLVGLAAGLLGGNVLVASGPPVYYGDDLYLESQASGDLPVDDEDGQDFGSGSGSGDFVSFKEEEEVLKRLLNISGQTEGVVRPSADSRRPPTAAPETASTFPMDEWETRMPGGNPTADWFTQVPVASPSGAPSSETVANAIDTDVHGAEEATDDDLGGSAEKTNVVLIEEQANPDQGRTYEVVDSPTDVTSESMWERTEVLAAVIACVVVGLLFAVFLLLLLAYRMKKKDEGSYDLGDTKLTATAYQKAPTKEFYA